MPLIYFASNIRVFSCELEIFMSSPQANTLKNDIQDATN